MAGRPPLELIRSVGHWAFVSVPDEEDLPCIIHFWHRRDLDPIYVAHMLAHEIGHISDGGPKPWLEAEQEEERAEEFARNTRAVVEFMIAEGMLLRANRRTMPRKAVARRR